MLIMPLILSDHLSGFGIKVVQCSLPKVARGKEEVEWESKDKVELKPSEINKAVSTVEEAIF